MLRIVENVLLVALLLGVGAFVLGCTGDAAQPPTIGGGEAETLRMVVMDPLSAPLACACVEGFAQRDYDHLGRFLSQRLGRPVDVAFHEDLIEAMRINPGKIHLVIGKRSVVVADAKRGDVTLRPIAMLTDKSGSTDLTGIVVVRDNDPAKAVADLKGRRVLLGPADSDEKSAAAKALFAAEGVPLPKDPPIKASGNAASVDVVDNEADAAVISNYALALLEGCDAIDKGALRVIGRTKPVPFVTAFVMGDAPAEGLLEALLAVKSDAKLLTAIESRDGFTPLAGGSGE